MSLRDYTDVYVADCGQVCESYAIGREHEKSCLHCKGDEMTEAKPEVKLQQLAELAGYDDYLTMIEENICDSLAPAICTNEGCDFFEDELEHDAENCHCELCETDTVKSCMVLMYEVV